MKKIIIAVVCIACIVLGFVAGHYFNNKSDEKKVSTTNNIVTDYKEETKSKETEYPFDLYQSFLSSSGTKVIEKLNNNPVDKKYCEKYSQVTDLQEEQNILTEWNKAYEQEFENAKKTLENSLKSKSSRESLTTTDEVIDKLNDYYNNCSGYADSTGELAYYFEEFYLGHGTDHIYDVLSNPLEINRENTLRIVECIYLLDGDYTWAVEQ